MGVKTSQPNKDFTVVGEISATQDITTSGKIYTQNDGNSDQWNQAYNISTAYQSASSSFATNTALNAASSILLPTSVYNSTSGSFATIAFSDSKYLPLSGGTITGSLSVLGNITYIDTNVQITSAMFIDTASTETALRITQRGSGDVIRVEDSSNPDATPFIVKSDGLVGIGTDSPNSALTVVGDISSRGSGTFSSLSANNVLFSSARITDNLVVLNINNVIPPTTTITTVYNGNAGLLNSLFGYNFFPLINSLASTASPTLLTPFISAGLMTRQPGIGGFASTVGWGSTNYVVGGSNTVTNAINANEWYTIPIWSDIPNTTITLSSIGPFFMVRSPAGPRSIAFGYNFVDNPNTATYTTLGVNVLPTPDLITDISGTINPNLATNPITLSPGVTAYIYIIPYQATGNGGTLRFQGGAFPFDLYFLGRSVNTNTFANPPLSCNLFGSLSATGNIFLNNDIEITDFTRGIILRSPNGSRWRTTMTNSGTLSSVQI